MGYRLWDKKNVAIISLVIVLVMMIILDIVLFKTIENLNELYMYHKTTAEKCQLQYDSLSNDYEKLEEELGE